MEEDEEEDGEEEEDAAGDGMQGRGVDVHVDVGGMDGCEDKGVEEVGEGWSWECRGDANVFPPP